MVTLLIVPWEAVSWVCCNPICQLLPFPEGWGLLRSTSLLVVFPHVFFSGFKVSCLRLRFSIRLNFFFVQSHRKECSFSHQKWISSFLCNLCWKGFIFSNVNFSFPLLKYFLFHQFQYWYCIINFSRVNLGSYREKIIISSLKYVFLQCEICEFCVAFL